MPKLLPIALALLLTACTATQIDRQSNITLPENFQHTGQADSAPDLARWWQQWPDPQLGRLIEQGLQHNHSIAIARSRLEEARATARLAEAALLLGMADEDIAVNVQGDEPLIDPALINRTAELLGSSSAQMATAAHPIADAAEFLNPNCVKVVLDQRRNALYFSRAPIAWPRDAFAETQAVLPEGFAPLRHIGLYAYRVGFLHQYVGLPPSPLESIESLEQLRVLWHGGKIAVTVCDNAPAAGVDTAEDLQRVRDWFARHPEEAG